MPVRIGNTGLSNIYIGSQRILRAYVGSQQVYNTGVQPIDNRFIFTIQPSTAKTFMLPAGGANNFTVNWGDGSATETVTSANPTHNYASAGTYQIIIDGTMPNFGFNNTGDREDVISLDNYGNTSISTTNGGMWQGCSNMATANLNNAVLPADMSESFRSCGSLTTITTVNTDWSNVTTLSAAFLFCNSLTTFDTTNLVSSSCTNIVNMFYGNGSITTIDTTGWDTSSCGSLFGTFNGCSSLTAINLSNIDTSGVNDFSSMLSGCSSLTNLDISVLNYSSAISLRNMLTNCTNLVILTLPSSFPSTLTNVREFAMNCTALTSAMPANLFWENATITSFDNAFTGSLAISNYVDIPDNWKGL